MKAVALVAIACGLLGACTNLQRLQGAPPGAAGNEFTRALAQQYRTFAADEWNARADFDTSEWFAAKALRANAGEAVPPEDVGALEPFPEVRMRLAEARARLVRALDGGARRIYPAEAAVAQRAFECWLARGSAVASGGAPWRQYGPSGFFRQMAGDLREPTTTHLAGCEEEFHAALVHIEGSRGDFFPIDVYFDVGRADLTQSGRYNVAITIEAIRAFNATRVLVMLSERRRDAGWTCCPEPSVLPNLDEKDRRLEDTFHQAARSAD